MRIFGAILFICLFFGLPLNLHAQDIHFSQTFASPIALNPAQTGFFDGSYRIGMNYKQQWPWAIDDKFANYNTSSASADFSILDKKIHPLDWAGTGFNFVNDMAGDGNLTVNKIYWSVAYHKGLDRYHKHFLSAGFQAGFVHRKINFQALFFDSQWEERVGFDLSLPSNEVLSSEFTTYLDLAAGIQSSNKWSEKFHTILGLSLLHFNRPNESFYGQENRLGMRPIVQLSATYSFSEKWGLQIHLYESIQKKANEFQIGALAVYNLKSQRNEVENALLFGSFYRFGDAITPMVGIQKNRTRLIVNYDIQVSNLSKASKGIGGLEISLTHVGDFKNKKDFTKKVYCPSF